MANELVLYGTVGKSWWDEEYFTAKQVRESLAKMSGDLLVRINSGGGIATEGQAIYTALKDYTGKVTVQVDGVAASAASLIAMAGDEIVMRLGAWMLIHDPATPWTMGRGTEDDHRKEADLLAVVSNAYADIYAQASGLSREEARRIMKDETVIDGPMAVDLGFATRVEESLQAEPEARFDYRMYAHAPQELRRASEKLGLAPEREAVMAMIAGRPRTQPKKEPTMAATKQTAAGATLAVDTEDKAAIGVQTPAPEGNEQAVTAVQAVAAANARARRITDAVAMAGLPIAFASDMIGNGASVEACLDQINAKWKDKGDMDTPMAGRQTTRILRDERETMRDGMTSAIVAQLGRTAPDDKGRAFMGMSLAEMGAEMTGYRGSLRTSGDIIRSIESSMHSTSDFPIVLENALNKRLADSYLKAVPTYRDVAERMDFTDFRPHPVSNIGDFPNMQLIREGGEIQFGTVGEKKETLLLQSYASGGSFSRQMIVNDDLGGIDRILSNRGTMVALFEDQVFWAMFLSGTLTDGPTLTETGRQVFSTNVADNTKAGSAAAITIATLSAARAALRTKRALPSAAGRTDGQLLNLNPAILLVGPAKETEAQQIVAPIQAQQAGSVNVFSGTLRIVVTPYITDNAWYVLADPTVLPNFAYGFLSGEAGPRLRMDEPFGVQGMRFTVEEDFGTGAIDNRGGWKNPGA